MCTLQSVKKVNMCEKGKFIHELRDTHFHLINDVIEALLVMVHFPTNRYHFETSLQFA